MLATCCNLRGRSGLSSFNSGNLPELRKFLVRLGRGWVGNPLEAPKYLLLF